MCFIHTSGISAGGYVWEAAMQYTDRMARKSQPCWEVRVERRQILGLETHRLRVFLQTYYYLHTIDGMGIWGATWGSSIAELCHYFPAMAITSLKRCCDRTQVANGFLHFFCLVKARFSMTHFLMPRTGSLNIWVSFVRAARIFNPCSHWQICLLFE